MSELLGNGQSGHTDRSRFKNMLTPAQRERVARVDALDLSRSSADRITLRAMCGERVPSQRQPPPPQPLKLSRDDAETAALLAESATLDEVAAAAGVATATLYNAWRRYGIKVERKARARAMTAEERKADALERMR
jgi:hypothetical protein